MFFFGSLTKHIFQDSLPMLIILCLIGKTHYEILFFSSFTF